MRIEGCPARWARLPFGDRAIIVDDQPAPGRYVSVARRRFDIETEPGAGMIPFVALDLADCCAQLLRALDPPWFDTEPFAKGDRVGFDLLGPEIGIKRLAEIHEGVREALGKVGRAINPDLLADDRQSGAE